MKIAHLIFSFDTGGTETMLVDIMNEQVKTENVNLFIINKSINDEILRNIDNQVKVVKINRTQSSKNPFPILKLNYLLNKLNPDIIHCHNNNAIDTLMLPSIRKKAVLTIHDTQINYPRFNKYKKRFVISNAVMQDIQERYKLKSTLVYNGIRIDDLKILEKKKQIHNAFRIVQVGRLLHEKKGQDLLLRAISLLKDKNIFIDFIGDGISMSYLKQLVNELELNDSVTFLGQKDRSYIYQHLCEYDLLVQPSLFEGFGLTVAEGMAAKIPVLVSDIEGPMEVIGDGMYGYHFKTQDVDDLAFKLNEIIENYDKEEFRNIVDSVYEYVKEKFEIKQTAQKYIQEYKNLLFAGNK